MDKNELIKKIIEKKEFSDLPLKDVEIAFEKFYKSENPDFQNIKLTRNFLRKIYSSFTSRKLLGSEEKIISQGYEWVLMKHKSTKERYPFYEEIYSKIFNKFSEKEKISVIDLGAGVNGFSFNFIKKNFPSAEYYGVEAIGQLVHLMNYFFKEKNLSGGAEHFSLFEIDKIKKFISSKKSPRVVLLFKVIDSLESVERNYSKKLIEEIVPISERVVVSFATKSLGNRKKFSVQRGWLVKFVKEKFNLEDDFELGGERYLVFSDRG